jgi:amino acid transporter
MAGAAVPGSAVPHLRRVLTLWDLIFYGIVLIMPIAPVPRFGVAQILSHGHFVTTMLIALAATMFTAVSYGRMATLFPVAGSAYTCVGPVKKPKWGFSPRSSPSLWFWPSATCSVLRGGPACFRSSRITNPLRSTRGVRRLDRHWIRRRHDAGRGRGNPKRNVMLATVLVCAFTGIFAGLQIYLGQRAWPDFEFLPNPETAFMDVTRWVGGTPLFQALGIVLILATVGAGWTGQVGAARLLFGMGRDKVLPPKLSAYLHPRRHTPTRRSG